MFSGFLGFASVIKTNGSKRKYAMKDTFWRVKIEFKFIMLTN